VAHVLSKLPDDYRVVNDLPTPTGNLDKSDQIMGQRFFTREWAAQTFLSDFVFGGFW
jgi:hypothetical protein